jgi:hypothetical protein
MEVGEAKRLRTLEEENLRLKPLVAASFADAPAFQRTTELSVGTTLYFFVGFIVTSFPHYRAMGKKWQARINRDLRRGNKTN